MCEAFQQQGMDVELWVPTRRQAPVMKDVHDIWRHYDVETPFRITYLPTPDFLILEHVLPKSIMNCLHSVQNFVFALSACSGISSADRWVVFAICL